ncbi:MAG: hypothetical protein ABI867_23520 [Kofleriaceae bacterium]
MLDTFVMTERSEIISRAKARVIARTGPQPQGSDGIPAFLDQLVNALRLADSTSKPDHAEIRASAKKHGDELLRLGLTIEEVVHEYGDVCQTITELVIERAAVISTAEFRVMNLCLDDAIASAVTEFSGHRERTTKDPGTEPLGKVAHDLRNLMSTARTAFEIIKRGQVAPGGSTGVVLDQSLLALSELIERALAVPPTN